MSVRPGRRSVAAAIGLGLVLGTAVLIRTQLGVQAATPPVPGEIAFSRSIVPSPSPSPSPTGPVITAALAPPERPTHLARVVAAAPYPAAAPFAAAPTTAEFEPAWGPDGNRIAYTCAGPDSDLTAICVADGDGRGARRVTAPPPRDGFDQEDGEPAWSPDGTTLAFTRTFAPQSEGPSEAGVFTVPVGGGEADVAAVVDLADVFASHPSWSPDGTRIAYQREELDREAEQFISRIAVVPPVRDDAAPVFLTQGPDDIEPAWSPDGRSLAFIQRLPDFFLGGTLALLDLVTGNVTELVPSTGRDDVELAAEPAWSPDSVTIAYTWWSSLFDSANIQAVPAAGGTPVTVAAGPTDDRHPSWRPTADLRVEVGATTQPLRSGEPATIVATVTNGGPAAARAVRLTVRLSGEFVVTAVAPAACELDAGLVTCDFGVLAAGASAAVSITGRPETFGIVVATANATSTTADLDPNDNTDVNRFSVQGTDLAVAVTAPDGPVLLGEAVTYAVTVTRVAGDSVEGAVVEITLPDNVTLAGIDPGPDATCTSATGSPIRCVLPPLGFEGPDSATVTVFATAAELGERPGSARVIAPVPDVDPANDTAAFTTRVVGAQLAVVKQAPAAAVVGTEFDYDLGIRNGGEREISGATVVDQLPAGLVVIAAESATARCTVTTAPAAVTCALPPLPPAPDGDLVRVRLRVRATAPGTVRNTACVRAVLPPENGEPPPDGVAPARVFEDCDDVTTQVGAGDLAVTVTAQPPIGYVGGRIDATVVVRNAGVATVPAAVRLRLPANACETPAATGCTAQARDAALGPLAPGAAETVVVHLVPVDAGPATVAAQVLPTAFDATADNDRAEVTVPVRRPGLVVSPPIGPPGFVATVRATDFPPGATVRLLWDHGVTLAGTPVVVPPDGTFQSAMLVADRDDALGPRQVVAVISDASPVSADFLVVPSRVDPPDFAVRN